MSHLPADRSVGCHLELEVQEGGAAVVLQVAVARHESAVLSEALSIDGGPGTTGQEVDLDHLAGGRYHLVHAPAGPLTVRYEATVGAGPIPTAGSPGLVDPDTVAYLRPSRYCPSDVLLPFAQAEVGPISDDPARAQRVADWVFERLAYDLGVSVSTDGAVETLLAGRGGCRDFSHLTVALCRALEVPARLVSVYAPGLTPMDFHAVSEVLVEGEWRVLDATRLAPRSSLVRIATGRDAADTAFATTLQGHAELLSSEVWAVVEGDLPADDHAEPMRLI